MNARELMEQRGQIVDQAKTLAAAPALSDEQRSNIDNLLKQADGMSADIKRLQAVEALAANADESAGTRGARMSAPSLNLKTGYGKDTESRAFLHYLRTGDASRELRASNATDLNIGTAADGGVLVPTGLLNRIIAKRNESDLSAMLGVTMVPGLGTTVEAPFDNGTANEFVSTAEANSFDLDGPALSKRSLTLVKYTKKITLSYELLEDEDARLDAFLGDYVGRALAKTHNSLLLAEALATGTAFTLGAQAAATAADIPGIVYSLPDGYQDNAAFVMRRATEGAYRALTGSAFQFVPTPAGGEGRLWGFPIHNSAYAEAIATTKKSMVFGNWEFMLKREAPGLTMLRDPYSSASTGQVNIFYYIRTVYKLSVAEALRVGTHP